MSTALDPKEGPSLFGELRDGFTVRNPVFATTVGLCPSLAVTAVFQDTVVLSVVIAVVLLATALAASLLRTAVGEHYRTLVTLSLAATLTVAAELIVSRYAPVVRASLGIYLPLVAVNAVVISQAQEVGWRSAPGPAFADAAGRAIALAAGLLVIAVAREAIGFGSITLRAGARPPVVVLMPWLSDHPVRVVGTSAGAFLIVGYLAAVIRALRRRVQTSAGGAS